MACMNCRKAGCPGAVVVTDCPTFPRDVTQKVITQRTVTVPDVPSPQETRTVTRTVTDGLPRNRRWELKNPEKVRTDHAARQRRYRQRIKQPQIPEQSVIQG